MHTHPIFAPHTYFAPFPVVDVEFDRFEMNDDLEIELREAEIANFYHDALNEEE